jgi:pimeloyl-ACP methyl ester carboxylesterase
MKPLRFYNVWRTKTPEDRAQLIATMKAKAGIFSTKPGFVSLIVSENAEDGRVVAEGLWATKQAYDDAVANNPEAHAGRAEMEALGVSEPGLFVESFRMESSPADSFAPRDLSAEARSRWKPLGFKTRFANLQGARIHVAQAGQGDLLILLHGYPQSGEVWRHIAPAFARNHTVLIPDLRGMGLSDAPEGPYDFSTVAADIHQLVRETGQTHVKIVGHDWGGAIGAFYALQHREDVSKLAFIESAVAGCGFEKLWNFATPNPLMSFIPFLLMGGVDSEGDVTADLMHGREEIFLRHLWQTFTADKVAAPFEAWAPYVAAMARPGVSRASASYYRSAYASAEQSRSLATKKLEIPVLAIAGRNGIGEYHKSFVEAFAERVHGDVVLDGAGHFLPEERPREVLAAIASFLR